MASSKRLLAFQALSALLIQTSLGSSVIAKSDTTATVHSFEGGFIDCVHADPLTRRTTIVFKPQDADESLKNLVEVTVTSPTDQIDWAKAFIYGKRFTLDEEGKTSGKLIPSSKPRGSRVGPQFRKMYMSTGCSGKPSIELHYNFQPSNKTGWANLCWEECATRANCVAAIPILTMSPCPSLPKQNANCSSSINFERTRAVGQRDCWVKSGCVFDVISDARMAAMDGVGGTIHHTLIRKEDPLQDSTEYFAQYDCGEEGCDSLTISFAPKTAQAHACSIHLTNIQSETPKQAQIEWTYPFMP